MIYFDLMEEGGTINLWLAGSKGLFKKQNNLPYLGKGLTLSVNTRHLISSNEILKSILKERIHKLNFCLSQIKKALYLRVFSKNKKINYEAWTENPSLKAQKNCSPFFEIKTLKPKQSKNPETCKNSIGQIFWELHKPEKLQKHWLAKNIHNYFFSSPIAFPICLKAEKQNISLNFSFTK